MSGMERGLGMMKLDEAEMLELWRLVRGFEPLRADMSVERTDGVDLDRLLRVEMRQWYERQLATLPAESLPEEDLAGEVKATTTADGAWRVELPERCLGVRVVKLASWSRNGRIEADGDGPTARNQRSEYLRGSASNPVVLTSGRELRLYMPAGAGDRIESLRCSVRPPEGEFWLTPGMEIVKDYL